MLYRKILIRPFDGFFQEQPGQVTPPPRRRFNIHWILFFLTLLTTTAVGAMMAGKNPFLTLGGFASGFPFSLTIMGILGIHELAHYFAGRRWGIAVTPPYFIPAPFPPIGTFGAVIRMKSSIPNRRALVDVGVSGPLAGFVVSLIACVIGLQMSQVVAIQDRPGGIILGDSLLFKLLGWLVIGPIGPMQDIELSPIAFAGWIGLFVTALNLMPFGQLDGGHVLFAVSPKMHELLRRIRIPLLLLFGIMLWTGWFVWAVLLFLIGGPHPYPDFMEEKLGKRRTVLAAAALVIFILCAIPSPVKGG
jgi:membrane-associated protease RseP (regulator of RpoE activity)